MRRNIYAILAMLVLVLCAGATFAQSFPGDWHYYVDVDVNTGQYARTATPVELNINFTNYLSGKTLDVNSVRVAEFTTSLRDDLAPLEVFSQFDKGAGFDAATNAVGEVVWILRGTKTDPNATGGAATTNPNETRYYRVYFDDIDNPKTTLVYSTDLSYDLTDTTKPKIINSAYEAQIYSSKDTIYTLYNKLTSQPMWNGTSTGWNNSGMYYAITVYNTQYGYSPVDQFSGSSLLSSGVSANKAIRVTYTSNKRVYKNGYHYFDTVRKFYSGVPYFKEETKFTPTYGDQVWTDIQLRWLDTTTPKRTICPEVTEANPIDATADMPMAKMFDYGDGGGIGHLFSGNALVSQLADNGTGAPNMWNAYYNHTDGGFWRYRNPWSPLYLNHAVMVHNGTDQATAEAEVSKWLADYGCPVQIMVAGTGSITGKVTDADNASRTVKNALVRLWVNDTYIGKTYTSALGDYTFSNVPAGTAKISVKCDGFDTLVENNITVTAGIVTTKNVSLPSIIFANKFFNLKTDAFSQTWKFIKHVDILPVNAAPVTTSQAEIDAFAGPTLDAAVPTFDISVPNVVGTGWDDIQPEDNTYGWYRTIVNIPADWAGRNLRIRDFKVDDALEVYFNGVKVGSVGVFDGATWYNYPCDFVIPSGAVNAGGDNVLAIKVFDGGGGGGIYAGGPILEMTAAKAEVTFEVKWAHTPGGISFPLEGAAVSIAGQTVTTNAEGKVTFGNIPGEFYTATVSHPDYGTKTLNVEVPESGTENILVEFLARPTVTFEVKGPQTYGGEALPIEGATVTIAGVTITTGADGKATTDEVQGGTYTVTVSYPGYATKTLEGVVIPEYGTEDILVDLALLPTVTFEVKGPQTYGGPALPIEGATITVSGQTFTTDVDGKAIVDTVPGGTYNVTVNHPNYGTKTLEGVVFPETGTTDILVEYDAFHVTVTGVVKKAGALLPNARVVVTNGDSFGTALTNAEGAYTITGVNAGSGKLTANALNAVPVIDQAITLETPQVTAPDVNLQYGITPVYDDFSGTTLDMNKWEFFNTNAAAGNEGVPSVPTLVDGVLQLSPALNRGGILSTVTMPDYGTYEVVFPRKYTGVNQGFALIDPSVTADTYGYGVRLENESWFTKIFTVGNADWQERTEPLSSYFNLGGYPLRVTILRTGAYYDVFVNKINYSRYLGKVPVNQATGQPYLTGSAKIYLNGYTYGSTIAYFDEVRAGASQAVADSTLAGARAAANGAILSVPGVVVTASFADCFFVENTDRSAGMKVISTAKPAVGKMVSIVGTIVKENREVAIQPVELGVGDDSAVPAPVAVTGKVAGELDKAGAAAQGLMVKVAGKVTAVTYDPADMTKVNGYFLDDGSGLAGDGVNKGLYVIVDPAWGVSSDIVGTFKTIEGPLTVAEVGGNAIPAVRSITFDEPATFEAYNDCAWSADQYDFESVTRYGIGTNNPNPTSGYLKDYNTGAMVPATATFTQNGTVVWDGTSGAEILGSDSLGIFFFKVNMKGYIYYGSEGWYVDLTISGLNPNGRYEFVTTANRGDETYSDRLTKYTISDAVEYTNTGSTGLGVSYDNDWIIFCTGDNTNNGYIARWTNIKPSANGTFKVRAEAGSTQYKAYAFGGFMLKKLQ